MGLLRNRATPNLSTVLATLIAGILLPAQARAQGTADTSPPTAALIATQALDVVVFRPFGLVATIVGAALFVPAAIVTAPGGRDAVEEALDVFVLGPGQFVFRRPLGDF